MLLVIISKVSSAYIHDMKQCGIRQSLQLLAQTCRCCQRAGLAAHSRGAAQARHAGWSFWPPQRYGARLVLELFACNRRHMTRCREVAGIVNRTRRRRQRVGGLDAAHFLQVSGFALMTTVDAKKLAQYWLKYTEDVRNDDQVCEKSLANTPAVHVAPCAVVQGIPTCKLSLVRSSDSELMAPREHDAGILCQTVPG